MLQLTVPRSTMADRVGLCLLVACLGGCGSPGGPSATPWLAAGSVLTFTSGETGLPVSGASVAVGASSYTTDPSGRITLGTDIAQTDIASRMRVTLTVNHSAYLQRQTYLRTPDQTSFTLWPENGPGGIYPEYTQKLVYSNDAPPHGTLPLRRLAPGTTRVSVVPAPEIQSDARAMDAHRVAVERMTAGTEGRILYSLDSEPTASTVVRTVLKPGDPCFVSATACAWVHQAGDQITGAEIGFAGIDVARRELTVLHELGHTYGLMHSFDLGSDIMGGAPGAVLTVFTPAEVLIMRLMWQRPAGNRWPDDDRGLASTSSSNTGRHTEVISCDFGGR